MRKCKDLVGFCFVFVFLDVPPLEDLTEVVQRARGLRAQPPNDPRMRSDVWVAAQETGVADGKASSFGGFSKGFLLSSSNSKKSQKTTSQSSRAASQAAAKDDGDIPFLRPSSAAAAETRGPVFPEVQEAMKEAYPLLNTQGNVDCIRMEDGWSNTGYICVSVPRVDDSVATGEDREASSPLSGTAGSKPGPCHVSVPV